MIKAFAALSTLYILVNLLGWSLAESQYLLSLRGVEEEQVEDVQAAMPS